MYPSPAGSRHPDDGGEDVAVRRTEEGETGMQVGSGARPKLTTRTLLRWVPPLLRLAPALATLYLLPGRVSPRIREAAMLGVTSINRCEACEVIHDRWAKVAGLERDALTEDEVAAYAFGQHVAVAGPHGARLPARFGRRHRSELRAAAILMELGNLSGNRFLAPRSAPRLQIGDVRTARMLDLGMRLGDRFGLRRARARVVGGARGDILEIGIGTGTNLAIYSPGTVVHGIDVSAAALRLAARRASLAARRVTLVEGDAAALPFDDASFDTVVATFVLCSVGNVDQSLREIRRVLRPGGTVRLLEHARARNRVIGSLQDRSAPAWARVSGGCRLDHDMHQAVRGAGFAVIGGRQRAGGLLVEIVAA